MARRSETMEMMNPVGERCLTSEERQEIKEAWNNLRDALEPMDRMVGDPEEIDCENLYATCLRCSEAFDAFQHAVMRAKQVRLLHAAHGGQPT
jgi:hypothetical protein